MKINSLKEVSCAVCGTRFFTNQNNAKYCSGNCSRQSSYNKYHLYNPKHSTLGTSTIGIISEYQVILDLLQKGYEVFHAVSPTSSCDLAILKNGKLLRVEVKTGHYSLSGKLYKGAVRLPYLKADVLAIVTPIQITYEPPLPI